MCGMSTNILNIFKLKVNIVRFTETYRLYSIQSFNVMWRKEKQQLIQKIRHEWQNSWKSMHKYNCMQHYVVKYEINYK